MIANEHLLDRRFDAQFSQTKGLTWLPWIGTRYSMRPPNHRLLIVGESHYSNERDPAALEPAIEAITMQPEYTRAVISECCIDEDWSNRTLGTLPKLVFGTSSIQSHQLWHDVAFFNFIQRPMRYVPQSMERPSFTDFSDGWRVFAQVAAVLQPSCCLFIGVEASHSFGFAMCDHGSAKRTEKIGSTFARLAHVSHSDRRMPIHFVKHAGRYFSWHRWHSYLRPRCPEIDELAGDFARQ